MNKKKLIIFVIVVVLAAAGAGLLSVLLSSRAMPSTESGSNAKLNINAICESALAYMSFPDGASADAFVQECVEGKHPEVIEQWKQQQGITDDRAI